MSYWRSPGFVIKTEERKYIAGVKLYILGKNLVTFIDKEKYISDYIEDLSRELNGNCLIGISEGSQVTVTHTAFPQEVPPIYDIGDQEDIHCTAVGRALLANGPRHNAARILQHGLSKKTEKTIVDPFDFLKMLSVTEQQGYALDLGEVVNEVNCLSVPVLGLRNFANYAFCLIDHEKTLTESIAKELSSFVKHKTSILQHQLARFLLC